MPRKAATEAGETATAQPRRSSRIKEQPKEALPRPKKPRVRKDKKTDKEAADKDEKPKSSRGQKRAADEALNGDADAPAEKKVRFFF